MPIDAVLIRTNGWRQGSIFSAKDGRAILNQPPSSGRLILVSHDCDIVHLGQREPVVEVCVAEPLRRLDGTFTQGKNPRLLHLNLRVDQTDVPHSVQAADRKWIDRSVLEQMTPAKDASLDGVELETVTRWLAKRYDRAAFPDRFNERLRPAGAAIRAALRVDGDVLSALLLSLDPKGELEVGEEYGLFLVGLAPKEHFDNEDTRARGQRAVASVAAAMNECEGIEVRDFDLMSEDDFTLHDLRSFVEYSCEDLSYGEHSGDAVVPRL